MSNRRDNLSDEQVKRAETLDQTEKARLDRSWSMLKAFTGNNLSILIEFLPEYKDDFLAMQQRGREIMDEVGDRAEDLTRQFEENK